MMHKLGFDDIFCQWVMKCVQTVSYNVIINGEATGHIEPCRGIQQGDPLSLVLKDYLLYYKIRRGLGVFGG